MAKIITILTDFGNEDWFTGIMKGVIKRINPEVEIIDICHQIRPQNIREGAFVLSVSFRYFPRGTIHLVVVDPEVGSKRRGIAVKTDNYYFVAPDNGVLSYTLKYEKVQEAVEITNTDLFLHPISNTFHGRDIFAPVAAHLSRGLPIKRIGNPIQDIYIPSFEGVKLISKKELKGEIIYIDRFGNLISNIEKEELINFIGNNDHEKIVVSVSGQKIIGLKQYYSERDAGQTVALIGSTGHLEIGVNLDDACEIFGVYPGETVRVTLMK